MKIKYSNTIKFLAGLSCLFFLACGSKENTSVDVKNEKVNAPDDEIIFSEDQYRTSDIQTGHIEMRDLSKIVKVNGVIDVEPQSVITISAPLGGYVKSAGLLPGQGIKKGQVIAVLENPEFISLQQEYLETAGKFQYTEQEHQRQQKLREEDVNSSKTFQQVTADYKVLQARISGLEEKIKLAGISMVTLKEGKISPHAKLYSPINGFVKTSNVNIGKYVNPTDVMFELSDKSDLHLALNILEKDIDKIHVEQTVKFALANEEEYKHTAKIFLIGQASDNNRAIPVHCHFTEKNSNFLPGMYIKAWIETGTETQSTIQTEAIVQSDGQDVIVIQTSHTNGKYAFKLIPIKKGIEQGAYSAVTLPDGMKKDELNIIIKGAYNVLSAIKNAGEEE